MDENDPKYLRAKARVSRIRSFYMSLSAYIIVNIVLIIVNFITDPKNLWFYWVTLIWGIFLIVQAISTFSKSSMLGEEWERRKIQKYLDKDKEEK